MGAHDVSNQNGVQNLSVKEAFPHENYSQLTYLNDIMLLKVKKIYIYILFGFAFFLCLLIFIIPFPNALLDTLNNEH